MTGRPPCQLDRPRSAWAVPSSAATIRVSAAATPSGSSSRRARYVSCSIASTATVSINTTGLRETEPPSSNCDAASARASPASPNARRGSPPGISSPAHTTPAQAATRLAPGEALSAARSR